MKAAMYAIIKKDFRIVASNRRLFPALFIVPLVLTIVLPSIFVISARSSHLCTAGILPSETPPKSRSRSLLF